MKVYENGVYREMNAAEKAALQKQEAPAGTPTLEQRLEALEAAMLEQLLGGAVGA